MSKKNIVASKHTPGTWGARKSTSSFWDITTEIDGHTQSLAMVRLNKYLDLDDETVEANAHFIAAAPETKEQRDELLEALEELRKELRDNPDVKIITRSLPAEIGMAAVTRKADAAIAKAKGGRSDGQAYRCPNCTTRGEKYYSSDDKFTCQNTKCRVISFHREVDSDEI